MTQLHVMIDIETLGLQQYAMLLSVGAVRFNPLTGAIEEELELFPELTIGHIDPSTVLWWLGQPEAARLALLGRERSDHRECADQLQAFVRETGSGAMIWAVGPQFDIACLEWHLSPSDGKPLWHYRQIADARTMRLFHESSIPRGDDVEHTALGDARAQARWVSEVLHHLNYIPKDTAP